MKPFVVAVGTDENNCKAGERLFTDSETFLRLDCTGSEEICRSNCERERFVDDFSSLPTLPKDGVEELPNSAICPKRRAIFFC